MHQTIGWVAVGALVGIGGSAAPSLAEQVALNVGALEVAAPSAAHVGAYSYLAGSLIIPTESVSWIASLGMEYSPELEAWGLVAGLTVDYAVSEGLGLDLIGTIIHDQVKADWGQAVFFAGIGIGTSVFLERWTLSPSISLFRGLNAPAWSVAPGLNLALSM